MSNLKAGFARVNINPPIGITIRGYYKERLADGILDDIEVNALELKCKKEKFILITVENSRLE